MLSSFPDDDALAAALRARREELERERSSLEQEASARALAAEERAAAARARPRDEAASLLAVLAPMRAPIDAAIAWQEGLLRTLDKRVGEDRRERPVRFASPYRPPAVNAPAPAS